MAIEYISTSLQDTFEIGRQIAQDLKANDVVALVGELGAGKTTLIKGILHDVPIVASPTFTYLNIYPRTLPVYHFDLYRISSEVDFIALGFEEYLENDGVCLIEWAENIIELLPKRTSFIKIWHLTESSRKIVYEKI